MRNKKSLLILMAVILSATCSMTQLAQAEVVTNITVPVNMNVSVPCAAGGAGETVSLSGDLHVLLRLTIGNSGGIHLGSHFQPEGVSGLGQTTGDKYQATGVAQEEFNATIGAEETFMHNLRVIGQGNGNNFLIHEFFHVTVNANGDVTAFVDNQSVDCR
jgi:hypothetical protein